MTTPPRLRVGIHTGPVVAGVSGISYLLSPRGKIEIKGIGPMRTWPLKKRNLFRSVGYDDCRIGFNGA